MCKFTFIGAGSTVFAMTLMGDILGYPELKTCTLAFYDIDAERLRTSEIVARKVAASRNATTNIVATTERRAALDGAGYVICMIQVGGYKPATVIDFEIPMKYGLRQTNADTMGIGGDQKHPFLPGHFLGACLPNVGLKPRACGQKSV